MAPRVDTASKVVNSVMALFAAEVWGTKPGMLPQALSVDEVDAALTVKSMASLVYERFSKSVFKRYQAKGLAVEERRLQLVTLAFIYHLTVTNGDHVARCRGQRLGLEDNTQAFARRVCGNVARSIDERLGARLEAMMDLLDAQPELIFKDIAPDLVGVDLTNPTASMETTVNVMVSDEKPSPHEDSEAKVTAGGRPAEEPPSAVRDALARIRRSALQRADVAEGLAEAPAASTTADSRLTHLLATVSRRGARDDAADVPNRLPTQRGGGGQNASTLYYALMLEAHEKAILLHTSQSQNGPGPRAAPSTHDTDAATSEAQPQPQQPAPRPAAGLSVLHGAQQEPEATAATAATAAPAAARDSEAAQRQLLMQAQLAARAALEHAAQMPLSTQPYYQVAAAAPSSQQHYDEQLMQLFARHGVHGAEAAAVSARVRAMSKGSVEGLLKEMNGASLKRSGASFADAFLEDSAFLGAGGQRKRLRSAFEGGVIDVDAERRFAPESSSDDGHGAAMLRAANRRQSGSRAMMDMTWRAELARKACIVDPRLKGDDSDEEAPAAPAPRKLSRRNFGTRAQWTVQEDHLLLLLQAIRGTSWVAISNMWTSVARLLERPDGRIGVPRTAVALKQRFQHIKKRFGADRDNLKTIVDNMFAANGVDPRRDVCSPKQLADVVMSNAMGTGWYARAVKGLPEVQRSTFAESLPPLPTPPSGTGGASAGGGALPK